MGQLFGRRAAPPPVEEVTLTDEDRAVAELRKQRNALTRYVRKCEAQNEKETDVAKQLLAKKQRDRALLVIKRKQQRVKLIDQTEAMLENVQGLIDNIEQAAIQAQVFEALSQGKDMLQTLNERMPIDDVEELLLDTEEAVAYQQEISNLLAGADVSGIDDADVEDELDALLELEDDLAFVGTAVPTGDAVDAAANELPDAPAHDPTATADGVEEGSAESVSSEKAAKVPEGRQAVLA